MDTLSCVIEKLHLMNNEDYFSTSNIFKYQNDNAHKSSQYKHKEPPYNSVDISIQLSECQAKNKFV